jgi:hypothetical protein
VGWAELEGLLATWYRGQGYEVEHSGTGASGSKYDGGIDLKLRRPGEYVLVQVKHWNAYKVPHNDVHQLLGLMVNEGATGAIVVTSGEFTQAAIEAANRQGHVRLIDGNELRAMLGPLPDPASQPMRLNHQAKDDGLTTLFIRSAFALLTILFVVAAFNKAMHSLAISLQRSAQTSYTRPTRPQTIAPHAIDASPSSTTSLTANPCYEVIDKPSGTYIDHCAPVTHRRAPTAAEIRESRQKADEAVKVLSPNTPEL